MCVHVCVCSLLANHLSPRLPNAKQLLYCLFTDAYTMLIQHAIFYFLSKLPAAGDASVVAINPTIVQPL